jgi:hypothetical protein
LQSILKLCADELGSEEDLDFWAYEELTKEESDGDDDGPCSGLSGSKESVTTSVLLLSATSSPEQTSLSAPKEAEA